jgi:acylphosphatase
MNNICLHAYITGKVQGVWFRASTQKEAEKLDLTGWVKNLPDGRVEVLACGDRDSIQQLRVWLHQGPVNAKVTEVVDEELAWVLHTKFKIVS